MNETNPEGRDEEIQADVLKVLDGLTAHEDALTIEALSRGIDVRTHLGLPPATKTPTA